MIYRIDNGSCRGAFCYGNETSKFKTIDDAVNGVKWLAENCRWRTFPFFIVEIESGDIVHTIMEYD